MLGVAIIMGAGLLVAWLGGVVAVYWVLTRPTRRTYATAVARGRSGDPGELDPPRRFESWMLESRGRRLPVWDMAGDDPAGPVVILSHGWGDSRIGSLQRLRLVAAASRRVVAWDMPGHGDAPGISSLGIDEVEDLVELVERVGASEGTGAGRGIVLFGWSLGAGVSIAAGARLCAQGAAVEPASAEGRRVRVEGVIAEAPYRLPVTPAARMLRVMRWPAVGLLRPALLLASMRAPGVRRAGEFDRAVQAARLGCPLLVLHGDQDEICPVEDGWVIARAAPMGRIDVLAEASHNDLWQNEHRLARGEAAVRVFLTSVS